MYRWQDECAETCSHELRQFANFVAQILLATHGHATDDAGRQRGAASRGRAELFAPWLRVVSERASLWAECGYMSRSVCFVDPHGSGHHQVTANLCFVGSCVLSSVPTCVRRLR